MSNKLERIFKTTIKNLEKSNNTEKGSFYIETFKKHVHFYSKNKEEVQSIIELKPLLKYMKENHYTSNLD